MLVSFFLFTPSIWKGGLTSMISYALHRAPGSCKMGTLVYITQAGGVPLEEVTAVVTYQLEVLWEKHSTVLLS